MLEHLLLLNDEKPIRRRFSQDGTWLHAARWHPKRQQGISAAPQTISGEDSGYKDSLKP
jgi:hypothetical protein